MVLYYCKEWRAKWCVKYCCYVVLVCVCAIMGGFYPPLPKVFKVVQREKDYIIVDTRTNEQVGSPIGNGKDARYLCSLKNNGAR